jgi:hypothetical protein|nr:MAG TPA_asm: Receptor Binding Protein [Caudoviricetes sp.]
MAERYSFFNAEVDTSGNYDRTYLAEDIASYFASFVGSGVYASSADNLKVVPSDAMTVAVKAGKGWIKGYYYENDSDLAFLLDNADGAKGRIDSVVLRLDLTNRYLRVFVKKGALATNPVAPTLTRNADVYELQLATISVPAGATAIAEAQITDTRFNSAVCGVVAGVIEQIDATNLFSQYDDAFNTWFEGAKGILNSDTAIQLSNRIDTVDSEIQKIVDGTTQTTPVSHTHDDRYYTETEMDTKLNGKEPAFTKNNAFNKNFGTSAGTVCQGNDSRLSNARRASNITMSYDGNLRISYS